MNSKHKLFGAAALALASFVAPSANSADIPVEESLSRISATIDGWVGYWLIAGEKGNASPEQDDGFIYGLDGKLRFDVFDGISVQGDLSFDDVANGNGGEYYQSGWIGGGHLSWSNPDSGLLGIFAAEGSGESDDEDAKFWLMGGEGQLYGDAWTLYLQVGYLDAHFDEEMGNDAFHEAWFGRIAARYFFDPSSRFNSNSPTPTANRTPKI